MRLHVVSVGTRMPGWVQQGFDEYARRMPREFSLHLIEVRPEPREGGKSAAQMMAAEETRILAALPRRCRVVALDERGDDLTTAALARRLESWQNDGEDIALLIGGPDGLAPTLRAQAHERVRLSSLTLPHMLVRVLLAEQLYRTVSVLKGHPYHRD